MRRWFQVVLACTIVLTTLLSPVGASRTLSAAGPVEPKDVALRPSDLPPGFTVSKEETQPMASGSGIIYSVVMERPLTPEAIASGPIQVTQLIGRADQPVSYEGFLDELRRRAVDEEGYELVPGAPNDGGTASLQKLDGEAAFFLVGFIKHDMVVFTGAVGRRGVVSLEGTLTLAGVSSARYDSVLAEGAPAPAPAAASAPAQPEAAPPSPASSSTPPAPAPPRSPSTAPRPTGTIDSRLAPALRTLYGIHSGNPGSRSMGEAFRAIVEETGVQLKVGPLPAGSGGVFVGRTNTLTISQAVLSEDVRTVAAVLAHELTHAAQIHYRRGGMPDCVTAEVEAFQVQLTVWAVLYNGLAPGRTAREQLTNLLAVGWATEGDPFLYKHVVDLPGYQQQCDLWVP